MEIAHILDQLSYDTQDLPRDAIEAAVVKKNEITPYLLKILEGVIKRIDELIEDEFYQGHVYAIYLLAQFREIRAYPLIVKLFSYPGEIPHKIVGDMLTEDLARILASVCCGQIQLLEKMIENPALNEYVRAAALGSLVTLVGCKLIARPLVVDYLQTLFDTKLEKYPSFVWDTLVTVACELYPDELAGKIDEAFAANLVNEEYISPAHVREIFGRSKDEHMKALYHRSELIEDAVTEMEKWISV